MHRILVVEDTPSYAEAHPSTTATDEVVKLAQLRDQGVITDEEFMQGKAKVLARVE